MNGPGARNTRRINWISWLLALAMIVAVTIAALHFLEAEALANIAYNAQPWWLAVAFLLQVGTYAAQGETWRTVMRAAGINVPLLITFKLSLTKLFIDQALPSGGMSGTVVVARALEQSGVARSPVVAAMVVNTIAHYAAIIVALALALCILVAGGHSSFLILAAACLVLLLSVVLIATALALSGNSSRTPNWLMRVPLVNRAVVLLADADPALTHSHTVIVKSSLLQFLIILLDAATIWVLILALGQVASATGVFASFMVSTLFRTIGIVPGELGIFEAASVMSLKLVGVAVPVALAATLLFRGLSFWLPMVPGMVFARAARRAK